MQLVLYDEGDDWMFFWINEISYFLLLLLLLTPDIYVIISYRYILTELVSRCKMFWITNIGLELKEDIRYHLSNIFFFEIILI